MKAWQRADQEQKVHVRSGQVPRGHAQPQDNEGYRKRFNPKAEGQIKPPKNEIKN